MKKETDNIVEKEAQVENAETKKTTKKKKLTEKQKTFRAFRRLLIKIAIIALIIYALITYVGGIFVSHDINMYPAVNDGDLAITYRLGGYYNGDIVVYEVDGINRFGRVVGIYGDVIDIQEGSYTINGIVPYETIYYQTHPDSTSTITYPYKVKEGEVFVLNDLRDNTYDSRTLGGINVLKGKVVLLMRRRGF